MSSAPCAASAIWCGVKQAEPRSLLRRLLVGFMAVLLGIWLCALAHIVYQARADQLRTTSAVNKAWTRQIMLNIGSVAGQPDEMHRIGAAIERLRLEMFRELGFQTRARTQVWHGHALVYDSEPQLAAPYPAITGAGSGDAPGWTSWVERDVARDITIRRSEEIRESWMFTPSAAGYLLTPLVYSLPFLLLPAWFIVRVGLRPLHALADTIAQRSAGDLSALPQSPYRELAPLTGAINALMARLTERLARERDFLGDAAHELKTPLSVIQLNAHLLCDAADSERARQARDGLRDGVARATHTVHQLLAFERAGADHGHAHIDLLALLRERLALAAPLAMQRAIDIELASEEVGELPLHGESMAALLDNLIGNAIKYSPDGGIVKVRLEKSGGAVCVAICDQGPGIAPGLRGKVFERFYRIPGQDKTGSGLGLAIAERAAARNGAAIRLEDGDEGRGLRVVVEFAA